MADDGLFIGTAAGGARQVINWKRANRHGLIAGATGTGKTITLQVMAEGFSRNGVPVFISDVKGDLSGAPKLVTVNGFTATILSSSGICLANRATRSARPFLKWGRCCYPA
jgi:hypothetical protein